MKCMKGNLHFYIVQVHHLSKTQMKYKNVWTINPQIKHKNLEKQEVQDIFITR